MADGSMAFRRLMEYLDENRDAFENEIPNRTNVLDLAAHYPYSPERWRIIVDGSRVFPEYGAVAQYTHDVDRHQLQPAAGETVVMESAERPRYVVQYELAATFAFALNQSLTTGDRLLVGLYDGTDGWYMEQTGSHADDEADFVMERDSSVVYREADQVIRVPTTQFARLALQTGWYDITRQEWERSFAAESTRSGEDRTVQKNPLVATGAAPDERGPRTGNLPIHYEITADANTTGLELSAGSAAQVNLGETTPFTRNKVADYSVTVDTADTWTPLFALRTDPDRDIVNTQLSDLAIGESGTNADIEIAAQAFAPENVADGNGDQLTDGDFSTPLIFNPQNNVIEVTDAVEQIADNTGTLQTSTDNPGGFQIGHDSLYTGGGNTVTQSLVSIGDDKRPLYGRDIAVILANAGGTGEVTVQYRLEQDW